MDAGVPGRPNYHQLFKVRHDTFAMAQWLCNETLSSATDRTALGANEIAVAEDDTRNMISPVVPVYKAIWAGEM
jgi:hypothetical protein